MSKNPKKGQVAASSLIALGSRNKTRPTANTIPQVRRPKLDEMSPTNFISTLDNVRGDPSLSEVYIINYINSIKSTLIISSKNGKLFPSQGLALLLICKRYPQIFERQNVLECMCNILSYTGKESASSISSSFKPQNSTSGYSGASKLRQLQVLLSLIIYATYKESSKWPITLVKSYLDDSFGERNWVDNLECSLLVQNIETAFPKTGIDVKTFYPLNQPSETLSEIFNAQSLTSDNSIAGFNSILTNNQDATHYVHPRYESCKSTIDTLISSYWKENIDKKFMIDTQSRAVIRTLTALAGLPEVRGAITHKIDNWLSNKLQIPTLNMLTTMAHSCYNGFTQNNNDILFTTHLLLKIKYKINKPNIQSGILDCIRKLIEIHPGNLQSILAIFVNNELFGIQSFSNSVPPNTQVVTSNKVGTFSVTFPAVYYSAPTQQTIKILSDLLHNYIFQLSKDIRPVRTLLRDICRCLRIAFYNTNNIYSSFIDSSSNNCLPESLDLLEFSKCLFSTGSGNNQISNDNGSNDSSSSVSFLARLTNNAENAPGFKKLYMANMICMITDLQLLACIKPSVKDVLKTKYYDREKKYDVDTLRGHYANLRQIRHLACKWIKYIYRYVESEVDKDQVLIYLKQVLFLNVTRDVTKIPNSGVATALDTNSSNISSVQEYMYTLHESYGAHDVWANETDKACLIKGLIEIPVSEKLMQTLLGLGYDKTLPLKSVDIVEIVCQLILRASASSTSQIVAMNISKGENMVNNMFACCGYDISNLLQNPSEELLSFNKSFAFKETYWNVCQALVIIASHCPENCGAFLWENYPTVRNLMRIVITNSYQKPLDESQEIEEREVRLVECRRICDLEAAIQEQFPNTVSSSYLTQHLITNLPQGPARQPPAAILEQQQFVYEYLRIGDRLSRSRKPDFLLGIVKNSQSSNTGKSWIIDLVKKTSEDNVKGLPLLCLTEFIFNDLFERLSNTKTSTIASNYSQSLGKFQTLTLSKGDKNDDCLKRIVQKIRYIVQNNSEAGENDPQVILSALSLSIFNRLGDLISFTRRIARECFFVIMQPVDSPITCMAEQADFNNTLKSFVSLKIIKSISSSTSTSKLIDLITDSLKTSVEIETDVEVLISYIELFYDLSSSYQSHWLTQIADTLSYLLLNRPIILEAIQDYEHDNLQLSSDSVFTKLTTIFIAYLDFILQNNPKIEYSEDQKTVNIPMKSKSITLPLKILHGQLYLCCLTGSEVSIKLLSFFTNKNLTKLLFSSSHTNTETDSKSEVSIIPEWLINSGIESGNRKLMELFMNFNVEVNSSFQHDVTYGLVKLPADFCKAYLSLVEKWTQKNRELVKEWLLSKPQHSNVTTTYCFQKLNYILSNINNSHKHAPKFSDFLDTLTREYVKNDMDTSETVTPWLSIGQINKKRDSSDNQRQDTDSINDIISQQSLTDDVDCDSVWNQLSSYFNPNHQASANMEMGEIKDDEDENKIITGFDQEMFEQSLADPQSTRCNDTSKVLDAIELGGINEMENIGVLQLVFGANHLGHDFSTGHLLHELGPYLAAHSLAEAASRMVSPDSSLYHDLDPSRILDFAVACNQLPTVKPTVALPLVSSTTQPHTVLPYRSSPMVCRNEQEMFNLLWVMYAEANQFYHRSNNNRGDKHNSVAFTQLLSGRCELIYQCSNHPGIINKRGEVIERFLSSLPSGNGSVNASIGFLLYCHFLGVVPPKYRGLSLGPSLLDIDTVKSSEIQKVGCRILESLSVYSSKELQDIGSKSALALATRHPGLFLGLLNRLVAIVEGAIEQDYFDFQKKRSQNLFLCVLQLLEICCPTISELPPPVTTVTHTSVQMRHMWHNSACIEKLVHITHSILSVLIARLKEDQQQFSQQQQLPSPPPQQYKSHQQLANRLCHFVEARLLELVLYLQLGDSDNDCDGNIMKLLVDEDVGLLRPIRELAGYYASMKNLASNIERVYIQTLACTERQAKQSLCKKDSDVTNYNSITTHSSNVTTRCQSSIQMELLLSFRSRASGVMPGYNICNGVNASYPSALESPTLHEILDLHDVSRRDPHATGMMLGEIRKLLVLGSTHPSHYYSIGAGPTSGNSANEDVSAEHGDNNLVRIISRYLNTYPDQAEYFARSFISKTLSSSMLNYNMRPCSDLMMKLMCQIGMLVPGYVPDFMQRASRVLISGRLGHSVTFNFLQAMRQFETIVDEQTLQTLVDADLSSKLITLPATTSDSFQLAHKNTGDPNSRNSRQGNMYHHRGGYQKNSGSTPFSHATQQQQQNRKRNFALDDNPASGSSSPLPMPIISNTDTGIAMHHEGVNNQSHFRDGSGRGRGIKKMKLA